MLNESLVHALTFKLLLVRSLECLIAPNLDLEEAQKKIYALNFIRSNKAEPIKIYDPKMNSEIITFSFNKEISCDTCIISYASFNDPYPKLMKMFSENLKKQNHSDFILRIGSWPNIKNGCLEHSHIPYGFKACAFLEAIELGYKKIIWLDSSVEIVQSIQPLLKYLDHAPIFFRESKYPFKPLITDRLKQELGLSEAELEQFNHIASGILGINAENPQVLELIHKWHDLQSKLTFFHDLFPEQLVLSVLINRLGLSEHIFPNLCSFDDHNDRAIFRINYEKIYKLIRD